ncbi:MAG: NADH:ubiquinone oxidoreductase [Candidatus Margulisiibacteriota bacterium]|nr:MAG: hypothetical protein A2X43_07365 [Candidatus Margulisbacteria bacterium GWD2_39_127]OGI01967.1 MAG: hypothetical protein A2X42_09820 [Candidatus Margulisbacteria bacterium GWF2_38_17]PZM77279.1 MAG: NADH:ubiquinone oxidoreductase [Candidatus Margulisiibacteriota bacterium]HAR62918.1 NADH:ubiquinone oxidoreductase [Candidatus Margulisiibacteriota bacterium]HCT85925.1 NADH:ubiquinone oxidoreductase [Candidatus Margulisiibacteriota bacterium]
MIDSLLIRLHQGNQAIPDLKTAKIHEKYRGFPVINDESCNECTKCMDICPTKAITDSPYSIDLGKCNFCGDCARECQSKKISFTNFFKTATTSRNYLTIKESSTVKDYYKNAVSVNEKIKKLFGRSLKLRQVSAAGCNGCEMELNACSNVNFDMGRFGIEFVASPRHADGIVITGPISENMVKALEDTFMSTPDPKIVILVGSCAISGGIFADSPAVNRKFLEQHPVDLYVPGCPPHPLTFINGIVDFLGR